MDIGAEYQVCTEDQDKLVDALWYGASDTKHPSILVRSLDSDCLSLRSKFRAKVLAEHPDKGGDPKKFQLLNKAYNVLTDTEKRRRYDTTGRAEKSAEEEFVEGFAGGRHHFQEQDEKAIISLQDRIIQGTQTHEEGFAEWLRQRDQQAMVLTDKDFMKTHLFNASELATKINHPGPVQHVKPRPLKKSIDHDEVLVHMLAVPVDESMVYADLKKTGVCLGVTGVGRVEQAGTRVEDLQATDPVLVLPKPAKFSSSRPIGTARTLLTCGEEDLLRIPNKILDELIPEQICLTPTIVCAYTVLDQFGSKLKPGDSGEYGSKSAWADVDSRAAAPPTVRQQYERISELLVTMGAEEVFPDAVALLRWRDRNQRMLPKLALDGIATRDSCEQLIQCLQSGDKDAQIVVYGHGRMTKLVRANKFVLDTVNKVGEDASDAFSRADAADTQVVLIFPTLQEELTLSHQEQKAEMEKQAKMKEEEAAKKREEDERDKLKSDWLNLGQQRESNLLFTD
eukprot:symbB.v1.2.020658.t1/scaffold1748.1/size222129/6